VRPETNVEPAAPPPIYGGAPVARRAATARTHVLTIALEDYLHGAAAKHRVRREERGRFEHRLRESAARALELLHDTDTRATFFVAGSIADAMPQLLSEIAGCGHEIASAGYDAVEPRVLGRTGFRDDAQRARSAIERATGRRVLGYRLGAGWLGADELWMLDALAQVGYVYDSSLRPFLRAIARDPWRRLPHRSHGTALMPRQMGILEVPVSSARVLGLDVPIAGGGYIRQVPAWVAASCVRQWERRYREPYVTYFRVWELDPEQPRVQGAPALARMRQYRNLERMPARLRQFLGAHHFTSIADCFGLDAGPAAPTPPKRRAAIVVPRSAPVTETTRLPVTVVVPCYDESASLRYLANTLRVLVAALGERYDFTFLFVDDGSTDDTWDRLNRLFGSARDCMLVRHERNRGIAAAIRTGLEYARTEVVCSIDSDCTYDPLELGAMIAQLEEGVDVVTASPYHPAGHVRDVPGWRLFLSRSLSQLYRLMLHQRLHTYTSCFRVYRRSSTIALQVQHDGFLGIAEALVRHDLAGHRIVEHPTTLAARRLGESKMKLVETIAGHLGLLAMVFRERLAGLRRRAARA
jgi:polysaccharide deacetylase family protein (PEP-CTERM system associated)